jgi:hypothetical protein
MRKLLIGLVMFIASCGKPCVCSNDKVYTPIATDTGDRWKVIGKQVSADVVDTYDSLGNNYCCYLISEKDNSLPRFMEAVKKYPRLVYVKKGYDHDTGRLFGTPYIACFHPRSNDVEDCPSVVKF